MNLNLSDSDLATVKYAMFDEVLDVLPDGTQTNQIDYLQDHALHYLWRATSYLSENFSKRRDLFLWTLAKLLEARRVKLLSKGTYLIGTTCEQIELLREAWPDSARIHPELTDSDFYLWFFEPRCPVQVSWLQPDGSYAIAG